MKKNKKTIQPVLGTKVPRFAGPSTFARLPELRDVKECDVAIVGIPFDAGTSYRPGARFGPQSIRQASRHLRTNYHPNYDAEPFVEQQVADAGDIACNPFNINEAIKQIEVGALNLLTRGQTVENVPLEETEPVILKAGQMSLHHPRIVHGSGINISKERRIGFVIQSYIGSNVTQVLGKMYVQQARGEDLFNYHEHVTRPKVTMAQNDNNVRKIANEELSKIFYKDLEKKGRF